ncbi:protease adaptor protein RcdA [Flexibacterium corallicola]|uniref:protease adaptor protein RcdA n=1 Tax=Flexibacterium corallicola TaxID=3037259 RepID=UPI00286F6696|nr:DUF1465 family protein [Pseudovibrio sp. M1P-2-3]
MNDSKNKQSALPIPFTSRLFKSPSFTGLYKEGMNLIEETASYLDGEGREAARKLQPANSLVYASESMRLTTRLMQLASWLLLQRAAKEGEITPEQATKECKGIKIDRFFSFDPNNLNGKLPDPMLDLIQRSIRLQERIQHMDKMIALELQSDRVSTAQNPIADQISKIREAFHG